MDETLLDEPVRSASVKLRVKSVKDPKLEVFHNDLEERILSMQKINETIDYYEEQSGYQWNGTNFVFVIWDDENPENAVFTGETTGLDHPEMLPEYIKTLLSSVNKTPI